MKDGDPRTELKPVCRDFELPRCVEVWSTFCFLPIGGSFPALRVAAKLSQSLLLASQVRIEIGSLNFPRSRLEVGVFEEEVNSGSPTESEEAAAFERDEGGRAYLRRWCERDGGDRREVSFCLPLHAYEGCDNCPFLPPCRRQTVPRGSTNTSTSLQIGRVLLLHLPGSLHLQPLSLHLLPRSGPQEPLL